MTVYRQSSHAVHGTDVADGLTDAQATRGIAVVYYLRLPDGRIKIGTSRDALARLARHRRRFGDVAVLAVEFGGRDLEALRHQQFAHLLVEGREIFSAGPDLMRHVEVLALLDRSG